MCWRAPKIWCRRVKGNLERWTAINTRCAATARASSAFTRIERWMHTQSGDIHWRIISRDNQTSIFGRSTACRIYDPAAETRVFSWLLEESYDNLGNIIRYVYRRKTGRA